MGSTATGIFSAMVSAVNAHAGPADAGAPPQYRAMGSLEELLQSGPQDRGFTVRPATGGAMMQVQTTSAGAGETQNWVDIDLVVKLINEGRSEADFGAVISEEIFSMTNRVLSYFRNSGNVTSGDVDEITSDAWTLNHDEDSVRVWFVTGRFRVWWTQTALTT